MTQELDLKYLKEFYGRILKSPYYQEKSRIGCAPEDILAIIAAQSTFGQKLPQAFLEFLQYFGGATGIVHYRFSDYLTEGGMYTSRLVNMGNELQEKKLEENIVDTEDFSKYFFFYGRQFSLYYCFSNTETDEDPYIYEYAEFDYLKRNDKRFSKFLTWLVEAFDHDVKFL
jgi:hypothetical protein